MNVTSVVDEVEQMLDGEWDALVSGAEGEADLEVTFNNGGTGTGAYC
ncbi:hypothetical protein ACIBAC_43455 [Streptomyces sp. NPDC051362]